MDTKWKLIYEGNEISYIVENLIPQNIIENEPGVTCTVQFCLRTVGADFPLESYSLQSAISEFSTRWNNLDLTVPKGGFNRAKKEFISTNIKGHGEIQMERWNGNLYSEGISDHYV